MTIKYPETEQEFIEMLKDYNWAYRKSEAVTPLGRPAILDPAYDAITEDFRSKYPNSAFFQEVEEEVIDENNAVVHKAPMLSTEKAYTVEELKRWVVKMKKLAEELGIDPETLVYRLTPKLDGLAGNLDTGILATRGNGLKGTNVTKIFDFGVVAKGESGLGEIVMKKSYFDTYLKDLYPHPRNLVSGIVSADTVKKEMEEVLANKAVEFVPYSTLNAWEGSDVDLVSNLNEIRDDIRNTIDYYIDGFVIEVTNSRVKAYAGATNHHYKWQIAFKENGAEASTPVLDITLQVGRTGAITPVLELEPILLSGAVIRRVTAHHIGMLLSRKIGKGSIVRIVRSGEVIPTIVGVDKEAEYEVPPECPCCGSLTGMVDDFLYCNNELCQDQIDGKISHFFSTLDNSDGFGIKNIQKITQAGFNTLESIYAMSTSDFVSVGFGEKTASNLFNALLKSRRVEIEDWRFLAAFGISDLGEGDSKKLLKHFDLNSLETITSEELIKIRGFGPKTSISIPFGVAKINSLMKNMLNVGFNIVKTEVVNNEKLKDKKILFTGSFTTINDATGETFTRDEIEALASKNGAVVQSGISKVTNILVYGEKAGSKLAKAKEMQEKGVNIEIYTDKEFIENFF